MSTVLHNHTQQEQVHSDRSAHQVADIHDGERQVVAIATTTLRDQQYVVVNEQQGEVHEPNDVGPNVDCLIVECEHAEERDSQSRVTE